MTRFFLASLGLTILAVVCILPLNATAEVNSDPRAVKIVTSDIPNFWRAFDDAAKSTNPALTYGVEYFAPGTPGLWGFVPDRLVSPAYFASVVEKNRAYYLAARPAMMRIADERAAILADLQRYKQVYPQAEFPDIYFVVGALSSAGTSVDRVGLVLGAEMLSRPADLSGIFMPGFNENVLSTIEWIPPIVAHELTHFNQRDADEDTLLDASIYEGTAEFISQLVDGHNAVPTQWHFGCAHEAELWALFQQQMNSSDPATARPWLFSYDTGPLGAPPFIGYWIGSRIVQTYYDRQIDKQTAIAAMLHIKDFAAFLKASGYPEQRPPCAPQPRVD